MVRRTDDQFAVPDLHAERRRHTPVVDSPLCKRSVPGAVANEIVPHLDPRTVKHGRGIFAAPNLQLPVAI